MSKIHKAFSGFTLCGILLKQSSKVQYTYHHNKAVTCTKCLKIHKSKVNATIEQLGYKVIAKPVTKKQFLAQLTKYLLGPSDEVVSTRASKRSLPQDAEKIKALEAENKRLKRAVQVLTKNYDNLKKRRFGGSSDIKK